MNRTMTIGLVTAGLVLLAHLVLAAVRIIELRGELEEETARFVAEVGEGDKLRRELRKERAAHKECVLDRNACWQDMTRSLEPCVEQEVGCAMVANVLLKLAQAKERKESGGE